MNKPHTEETKRKISLALKGRKTWNKGKPFSPESRRKMSKSRKLLWQNPEYRNKMLAASENRYTEEVRKHMSEAQKGKKQSPETIKKRIDSRKGYEHSKETKRKISIALRRRKREPRSILQKAQLEKLHKQQIGRKPGNWKSGRYKELGYILVHSPSHPHRSKKGYVFEHRLVIEKHIGRHLQPGEEGHHINKIRDDNKPENLMAFRSKAVHVSFEHGKQINPSDIIFDGRNL